MDLKEWVTSKYTLSSGLYDCTMFQSCSTAPCCSFHHLCQYIRKDNPIVQYFQLRPVLYSGFLCKSNRRTGFSFSLRLTILYALLYDLVQPQYHHNSISQFILIRPQKDSIFIMLSLSDTYSSIPKAAFIFMPE